MVALLSMGIAAPEGAGYTLANHAVQIIPVIVAGLVSTAMIGFHVIRDVNPVVTRQPEKAFCTKSRATDGPASE
jgi:hypothetical protein